MVWKLFLLLLSAQSSSQGHPCSSLVGQTSAVCQQLFKHCRTPNGKEAPICQNLEQEDESQQDRLDQWQGVSLDLDQGVSVLNPVLDIYSETTSTLASSLHPDQILWTLSSIPTDLIGFYENFARGVRRGFNDIVSKVSNGGNRLYKDISSIVPVPSKPGYNSQNKVSTDDEKTNKRKDTKKTSKDDPNSPYSVNYDGKLKSKPNSGYSLTLKDEDGKKTGVYKYSSPQHSVSLSWPRQDQGDDWSVKQNEIGGDNEDGREKDTFKPHEKDEQKYTGYDLDYDSYGNIYLLSEEETDDGYNDRRNNNEVKDNFGYKSTLDRKPIKFEKSKSKYNDASLMVNLIKGTENLQKPWVQKPPQQRYWPNPQNQGWEGNPNKRRKTELKKKNNAANGARRFDQFAPNSVERKDFSYKRQTSSDGRYKSRPINSHKNSDVNYIDYFYY